MTNLRRQCDCCSREASDENLVHCVQEDAVQVWLCQLCRSAYKEWRVDADSDLPGETKRFRPDVRRFIAEYPRSAASSP